MERQKVPVALRYLETLGIPVEAVKLVVATHWHADHFRGIGQVIEACDRARFVLSDALTSKEFGTYVNALTPRIRTGTADHVSEMAAALEVVMGRSRTGHARAKEGLVLRRKEKPGYVVTALSPSQAAVDRSADEFAKLIPSFGVPVRRVPALKINDAAVAILIEIGDTRILLGSDVEATPDHARGWKAIIASTVRPPGASEVYKVAHHGGASGDSDEIWKHLLVAAPIAIMTPWMLAGEQLPTNADRDCLVGRPGTSYITRTSGKRSVPSPMDPAITGFLSEATLSAVEVDEEPGHIRLRKRLGAQAWRVELVDGAGELGAYDEAA